MTTHTMPPHVAAYQRATGRTVVEDDFYRGKYWIGRLNSGETVPLLHDPRWRYDVENGLHRNGWIIEIPYQINGVSIVRLMPLAKQYADRLVMGVAKGTGPDIETALCEAVNRMEAQK